MAIEHVIVDGDTLESLASQYLGDATQWESIADFNKLDYPYITSSASELLNYYATGYLLVTRTEYRQALVVQPGWIMKTKPTALVPEIYYKVIDPVTIPAGQTTGYIRVRCTLPGSVGNTQPNTITLVESTSTPEVFSVSNPNAFTNGVDVNVLVPGDKIQIPTAPSEVVLTYDDYLQFIGGTDISFDLIGTGQIQFDTVSEDVAVVNGLDAIKQAIMHELMTVIGENANHPDYGTEIESLIGQAQIPYMKNRIALEVQQSILSNPYVSSVTINQIDITGTQVYVDVTYKIANSTVVDGIKTTFGSVA